MNSQQKSNVQFWAILIAIILVSFFVIFVVGVDTIGQVVKAIFVLVLGLAIILVTAPLWHRARNYGKQMVNHTKKALIALRMLAKAHPIITIGIIVGLIVLRIVGGAIKDHNWAATTKPEAITTGINYYQEMAGNCRVHILEVDLNQARPKILVPTNFSSGKQNLSEMATASSVLAAINGDLFDEGGPQGLLANHGRMTAPMAERAALKFTDEGRNADVELFRFSTTAGVSVNGVQFPIRRSYNAMYVLGDVGVYTASRGVSSGAKLARHVLQAKVALNGSYGEGDIKLKGKITDVVYNPEANMVPLPGEIVITAANEPTVPNDIGVYDWANQNWRVDAPVEVDLPMTPAPGSMVIGGAPEIMRDRQYLVNEEKNEWCLKRTARTVVGISADHQHLLVMVAEGPPKALSASVGESLKLLPRACILHLGAFYPGFYGVSSGMTTQDVYRYLMTKTVDGQRIDYAINLDGGGSSTMIVKRSGESQCVTTVMEGRQRPLANGLGFVPR
jgi:hypothetical protein